MLPASAGSLTGRVCDPERALASAFVCHRRLDLAGRQGGAQTCTLGGWLAGWHTLAHWSTGRGGSSSSSAWQRRLCFGGGRSPARQPVSQPASVQPARQPAGALSPLRRAGSGSSLLEALASEFNELAARCATLARAFGGAARSLEAASGVEGPPVGLCALMCLCTTATARLCPRGPTSLWARRALRRARIGPAGELGVRAPQGPRRAPLLRASAQPAHAPHCSGALLHCTASQCCSARASAPLPREATRKCVPNLRAARLSTKGERLALAARVPAKDRPPPHALRPRTLARTRQSPLCRVSSPIRPPSRKTRPSGQLRAARGWWAPARARARARVADCSERASGCSSPWGRPLVGLSWRLEGICIGC